MQNKTVSTLRMIAVSTTAVVLMGAALPTQAARWVWPTESKTVSFAFHDSIVLNSLTQLTHTGIDIAGENGDAVFAAHRGVVSRIVQGDDREGNIVYIKHGKKKKWKEVYAHMQSISVQVGDRVEAGEQIGTVGHTGFVTGDLLHFEVRHRGVALDPTKFIK